MRGGGASRGYERLAHAHLHDSKTLTARRQAALYRALIADEGVSIEIACVSAAEYDARAASVPRAARGPDFLFVDGTFMLDSAGVSPHRHRAVVGGDALVSVVAAASVVAKAVRDALHVWFPTYTFARHKGYPTALHRRGAARARPRRSL